MRKILLSIVLFTIPFFISNAQRIAESKIDDFTGKQIVYTSWSKFYIGEETPQMDSEVRFRYEHNRDFMQIKIVTGNIVLNYREGAKIDFKTDRGIFSFENLRPETASKGKGLNGGKSELLGMTLQFTGDFNVFLDSKVEKIRYHFIEGYYDLEIPPKYQKTFRKSFELIINEVDDELEE